MIIKNPFSDKIYIVKEAMVNLVKAVESTIKTDEKQMKFLKRQLRSNSSEINKLRQSTMFPERMIAPIQIMPQYNPTISRFCSTFLA